jgi:hypothetical protein
MDFFGMPTLIEPSPGQLAGDATLLPFRPFDQRSGLTSAFAALDDPRSPDRTEPPFFEGVRSRVHGLQTGSPDPDAPDALRADPVFQLRTGRSPEDSDLASRPTLSPFANAISSPKGDCPGLVPPERTCPRPAAAGLPRPAGERGQRPCRHAS